MKNLIITLTITLALVVAGIVLLKPKPVLKQARAAEAKGKYEGAIDLYVEALFEKTEGMKLPDRNRSKLVSQEDWYEEVRQYMAWISGPPSPPPEGVSDLIVAIGRCTTFVDKNHFITDDSVSAYEEDYALASDWNRAFFPSGVTVEGDHTPLMQQAGERDISILRITALTSYTYTGALLDLASWRRTDFMLYPEDEVSLLMRPGKYWLICSSEVEFPDGRIWRSPKNVIEVTAPDSASLKTFVLKTRVHRER
ncbi:MAG: hypothetical protein GF418_12395 [Chitinivibrionales bacterium]|nr:hypothetical protein [Chitinivibrionales bacterium]MBD3396419.1 hypothetical protein [Chitinivibrionales bacterium]